MIHVVLCDDHAVLRRGIRDTLTEPTDIQVTGEAGGYSELREVLRTAACDVLLLDQPTNHLDLESIQALADGLARFPGNLLFSSHDHQFIDEIANRIIELPLGEPGCLDRTGTYEEFLEWKHNR